MPTIVVVEPHTLYRLGIVRLLTDTFPEATLLGMDYASLNTEIEYRRCELLLLSVTSAEASRTLLESAQHTFQPEAILLMADTQCALPSPSESAENIMGHVLKDASLELLIASVNLVLAGGTCFPNFAMVSLQGLASDKFLSAVDSTELESDLVKIYEPMRWPPQEKASFILETDEAQLLGITARQYEVLVLLARGMTIKGIAKELNISSATAKGHAEALYMRMDVNNRNEAVYKAVNKGARLGLSNNHPRPRPLQS